MAEKVTIGNAELWHGDCLEVMAGLADGSVQLLVTSPPYFNSREYAEWPTYAAYLEHLTAFVAESARVVADGRMLAINVSAVIQARVSRNARSQRFNIPGDLHTICVRAGLWFQEDIIWAKPEGAAINRNQRFSVDRHPMQWRANPTTEHILVYQVPTAQSNDAIIRANAGKAGRVDGTFHRSDLWAINPVTRSNHSAPFPVEIPERLIRYYTWAGDVVLDPYAGSGTTGIACANMGRQFIGIERDDRYFDIACERIENEQRRCRLAV